MRGSRTWRRRHERRRRLAAAERDDLLVLCEECLEGARGSLPFLDAVKASVVRGELSADADVAVARCSAGHEVVLRRGEQPASLARHDARQLQIG